MYIGPWQEYNLSKARASNRQHQQSLRNDIENAILSSLDPQTAQIALAAVNPYFNQTQNNINKNGPSGSIIMNNIDNYSSHAQINGRIVRRKVNNKSSLPPLSHQSPLPSSSYQSASAKSPVLSSNPVSARDRSINSASPITTVRSTQSEPMPKRPSITIASNNTATTTSTTTKSSSISVSSNYNKISSVNNEIDGTKSIRSNTKSTNNKNNDNNNSNKSNNNNNKGSTIGKVSGNNNKYINIDDGDDDDDDDGNSNDKQNGNNQPPYNARAMVNLLRLERNNNAKNKIAMLTGWKVSDSSNSSRSNNNNNSVGASSNVSSNDSKKRKIMIPPTSGVINKTDHVNMMKQLYLRGQGSDADYSNNYTNDNSDTQHSSTIIESSSATTNTTDKAITRLPSLTNHNMNNSGSSGVAYMSKDVMMIPQHHTSTISTSISTSFSHPVVEVKDFDLTDSDLGLVSKYFQTTTSAIPYNYNSRNGSITAPMMAMMIDNYSAGSNYILGIAESTSTSSYNGNINSNKANNYNNYDYNNSNSTSRGKHTTAYTFNDDDNEEYFDLENASQQQQQQQQRQQHLKGIKGLTEASVLSSTTTQQMTIMHNNEAIVDSFEGLLNWSNELELDIG